MFRNNLVFVLALSACAPTSGSSTSGVTVGSANPMHQDRSCLEQAPAEDAQDAETAVEETGGSYHEMVACGGLAFQLSRDVTQILVTSLLDAQGLEVTTGFVYDGEGRYVSANGSTDMVVTYLYGDDLQAGAEDEVVAHNLFDFDNYLRGIVPIPNLVTGQLEVHWDSKGPLVELLGQGANPPNPMVFSIDALPQPHELGRLKMVSTVEVVDARPTATVTYTLVSQPKRLNPLLDQGDMEMDLLGTQTITEKGAILTTTSWGVGYNDTAGALDGDIDFELESGTIGLEGTYSFANTSYPEIGWTCRG